ncbi:MAG: hypothetical protein ACE5G8_01070 [Anaerolineae bacterium]
MNDSTPAPGRKTRKKIPAAGLVIGIFQVAAGLWVIFSMAATGRWEFYTTVAAVLYVALGAGLLAVMEWARFLGVIVHAMALPVILGSVAYGGRAGILPAAQTAIACAILFVLTRPPVRARYRRQPLTGPGSGQ